MSSENDKKRFAQQLFVARLTTEIQSMLARGETVREIYLRYPASKTGSYEFEFDTPLRARLVNEAVTAAQKRLDARNQYQTAIARDNPIDDEDEGYPLKCRECGHVTWFTEDEYQNLDELACERCATPLGDD